MRTKILGLAFAPMLLACGMAQDVVQRDSASAQSCKSDHPSVGKKATLQTEAHGVSGVARMVNNCTIEIDSFNYDGGGLDVRMLASKDGTFTDQDTYLTNDILGKSYRNEKFTIVLPANVTLDDVKWLSVWCVSVGVSFGRGEFK